MDKRLILMLWDLVTFRDAGQVVHGMSRQCVIPGMTGNLINEL